ncbi:enoyl-CoA hydratase/isomerase family protein [Bacillus pumilus]|uniref:enoyl-CoA hydratase/isomerase family protein n=1 Tax=Bacillus pumilus TaxID=1408 RepID=UPI0011E96398|nr:enoyl-CoA hydratase/isomerase family protein [Bacillus pumilus]TYS31696.1 enoyl-CoA hydratase/isomerase family protein [Bacillus pumilus]TYS47334.1 enoyl-CoA hydratase/isomerase family protein [Bacillus pumilus]
MFKHILVDIQKQVGTITIHRPEVRNALNYATLQELEQAVDMLNAQEEIRIIVITGSGEKAFVSGADINELNDRKALDCLKPGMQGVYKKIEDSDKVTLAVINGHALGGGCELALACDLRIAVDHARIGLPELNLAIIPGAGGTQRLSRMIGKSRALEMILLGKLITGEEAKSIGLVAQSCPFSQLIKEKEDMIQTLLSKGPLALKLTKMIVHRGYDSDIDTAFMLEKLAQSIAFSTEDKTEGINAFLEKRSPAYDRDVNTQNESEV